ncbi:MAG: universal stress protein [Verrucomicrobiota bacterium]
MNLNIILVPVDFSPVTPAIYETAAALATRMKAAVLVLHVCEKEAEYQQITSPAGNTADKAPTGSDVSGHLNEAFAFFKGQGLTVDTTIRSGEIVSTILAEADRRGAGLIVMASHGHGALYSLLVGSTTEGVIRNSKVPVMIVPSKPAAH